MTVFITVVTVAVELVLGFALAMVMAKALSALRPVLRAAILIPYAVITVVSAFAWQFAFDINTGFVNRWFAWLPGVRTDTDWFGDQWTSLLVICLAEIWKTTPFISLLLLAGLAQVPEVLQEAAKVDGATWWQRLWRVTIPNMKAAIMVAAAVPHPRRVPDLRQHLHHDRRGQRHRDGVVPGLPDRRSPGSRSASARRSRCCCSSCVVLIARRLHQAVQGRPVARRGGSS